MTTIYDLGPVPGPSDDEIEAFIEIAELFERTMIRRFGRDRAEVITDWWHVESVAEPLCNGFEHARRRRILSDLNEEIRLQQEQDDLLSFWPPWVLVPVWEP
jgi:hypothetical protein